MYNKSRAYGFILAVLIYLGGGTAIAADTVDVRLVIDVSGSMQHTDPKNLRVPALELLVQLLPDGSRAGVWLFAEEVSVLVPYAQVDNRWREQALELATGVHSSGQLTDIGAALHQVVLEQPAGPSQVIFLTDGKVDIGTNARLNARERALILSDILPASKDRGAHLHTIALSADADAELMDMLSQQTDGLHKVVASADDLMSVFLQIFDQSVPAERLPLVDNRFRVDDSIDEFTALIFRDTNAKPMALITPSEKRLTADAPGSGVKWYAADSYDLITVTAPESGEWTIDAAVSEHNRVTIVSDLKLIVEPLPNNLVAGQALQLRFSFSGDGQRLTDPTFLQLMMAETLLEKIDTPAQWRLPLENDSVLADGTFVQDLPALKERGGYRLTLRVDGKTFVREFQHLLQVGSLLGVELKRTGSDPVSYQVVVRADSSIIDVDKTAVAAHVKTSTGYSELRSLQAGPPGTWTLDITPRVEARYALHLNVSGKTLSGENVSEVLPTQFFTFPAAGEEPPVSESAAVVAVREQLAAEQAALDKLMGKEQQPVVAEPAPQPDLAPQVEPEPEIEKPVAPESEPVAEEAGTINWLWVGLGILANIALLGLIYMAYRKFSTRKVSSELDEIEQQLNQPEAKTPKKSAPAQDAEEDPMAMLDAMEADTKEDRDSLFPIDEDNGNGEEPLMDDLDDDPDKKV
ncbi:MAG TPA: VWA domain-containing protein [Cellvibrionaceae bacterium]